LISELNEIFPDLNTNHNQEIQIKNLIHLYNDCFTNPGGEKMKNIFKFFCLPLILTIAAASAAKAFVDTFSYV